MFELREVDRPYPGLRPFEAWEAEIFFGRRAHVDRLIEILARERFLAVIGPSGSGKSSLVRAGLLPELPQGRLGTGTRWRVATMRPGNEPIRALARALLQREALGEVLLDEADIASEQQPQTLQMALLEAEMRRGPLALVEVLGQATQRQEAADARIGLARPPLNLLVLVDQFEELFTHLDAGTLDADARRELTEESDAFVNLLLTAAATVESRVFVVLTLRTDFLGACVRFADLPDAINRAQYLTPRLRPSEIEMTITGPAHHFGGDIVPVVTQQLINAVGIDQDQLPILQHALSRMWTFAEERANAKKDGEMPSIVQDDFDEAGGLKDALSIHADHELARLSGASVVTDVLTPEQQFARELFCAITEQRGADEGGQTVRRPQSLTLIAVRANRQVEVYYPVVRAFSDESVNFLRYQGDLCGHTVIDISHEALIRQWGRLRKWVTDEARRAGEYRRLRQQASNYFAQEVGASLLSGAALARALEWIAGSGTAGADGWRPNKHWAARYSVEGGDDDGAVGFDNVERFIGVSQAEAVEAERRAGMRAEQQRQAEKDAIERRAMEALVAEKDLRAEVERQRRIEADLSTVQKTRMNRMLSIAVSVAVALAAYSLYLWKQADEKRLVVEGQARILEGEALWTRLTLDFGRVNPQDADALLRLTRADDERVDAFVARLRAQEVYAERFLRAPASILVALVGSSPARRDRLERAFASPLGSSSPDATARTLAIALIAAAMADAQRPDRPLADGIARAMIDFRAEESDQWRLPARAIDASAVYMSHARRVALYEAIQSTVVEAKASPARTFQSLVAASTLHDAIEDAEKARLFRQVLALAMASTEVEPVAGAAPGRSTTLSVPDDPFGRGTRKDALQTMLSRSADTLPKAEIPALWDAVWSDMQDRLVQKPTTLDPPSGAADEPARRGARKLGNEAGRRMLELVQLGQVLTMLSRRIPDEALPHAYERVIDALLTSNLWTMHPPSASLVSASTYQLILEQLASRLAPERASTEAVRLLRLVALPERRPAATRTALVETTLALTRRVDERGAFEVARTFIGINWKETSSDDALPPVRDGVRAIWATLQERLPATFPGPRWLRGETASSASAAERELPAAKIAAEPPPLTNARAAMDKVVAHMASTTDVDELRPLGVELANLAKRTPQAQVSENFQTLLGVAGDLPASFARQVMSDGLQTLARRLDRDEASRLRPQVASMINAGAASYLWQTYVELAKACSTADCKGAATEMLAMMSNGSVAVRLVLATLNAVVVRLESAEVVRVAKAMTVLLAQTPEVTDASETSLSRSSITRSRTAPSSTDQRIRALEEALVAGIKRIPADAPGGERVPGWIIDGMTLCKNVAATQSLGRALEASANAASPREAPNLVPLIVAALPRSDRAFVVDAMGTAALHLIARQPASDDSVRASFALLNYPGTARPALSDLHKKYPSAPGENAGYWAFVAWAEQTWPGLPVNARPPTRQAGGDPEVALFDKS